MARRRPGIFVCSFFLTFVKVALTYAEQQPKDAPQPVRDIRVSDIVVPEDLGYIVEARQPDPALHPPIIIHIQEAHTNYEGQQHLIGILERLIEQHGLKLILVEGGAGDVSLAYLRSYGPPDTRKQVAEKYLKAGVLSGEEYLDMVSASPLILWGVERPDLYQRHLKVFLDAEVVQQSVTPILASLREAIDTLAPALLDPALKQLDAESAAFDAEQLGLAEYAERLERLAKSRSIPEERYPNLASFLAVHQEEQAIPLEQVGKEQRALIEELNRLAGPEKLEALKEQAARLKGGSLSREAFYASLGRLASDSGSDLSRYPALSRYLRYLERRATLQTAVLGDELDQLASRLRQALSETPESRRFSAIREQFTLVEKLAELRLSPDEYQRLKQLELNGLFAGWVSFLNEQLARRGLPGRPFPGIERLTTALPELQRFYETAHERDEALVENAIAKLKASNERVAALITGGFHSPRITQLLRERFIGVVVIAPRVTTETDERLYHAVLRYKSGRGSLDDVFALANDAAGSEASPQ